MGNEDRIDFEAALQKGLDRIAATEPDSGSTERFRKPGEHPAPRRTSPVTKASLTLGEFLAASNPKPLR